MDDDIENFPFHIRSNELSSSLNLVVLALLILLIRLAIFLNNGKGFERTKKATSATS